MTRSVGRNSETRAMAMVPLSCLFDGNQSLAVSYFYNRIGRAGGHRSHAGPGRRRSTSISVLETGKKNSRVRRNCGNRHRNSGWDNRDVAASTLRC
jgi:hypothetical protein